jgi:hypothetical protein
MHRRSGAALSDRLRWYTMHCEAAQMLIERGANITTIRHEELVADPGTISRDLFGWLGFGADDAHVDRIADRVFAQPHATRTDVAWSDAVVRDAQAMIARFPFLAGYTLDA